jgi:hypothetical protein
MPPPYSDRIFQGKSTFPGLEEWFYRTREGVAGPYFNREDAAVALSYFIKYCKDNGLTGGRDGPGQGRGEEAPAPRHGLFEVLAQAAVWAVSGRLLAVAGGPAKPPLPGWPARGRFKKAF